MFSLLIVVEMYVCMRTEELEELRGRKSTGAAVGKSQRGAAQHTVVRRRTDNRQRNGRRAAGGRQQQGRGWGEGTGGRRRPASSHFLRTSRWFGESIGNLACVRAWCGRSTALENIDGLRVGRAGRPFDSWAVLG